jgi:hypothetical protein
MDKLAPTKRAMTDPRGIQSVEVGLGILLPFIGASEPFKLSELAEQAGVSPMLISSVSGVSVWWNEMKRRGAIDWDATPSIWL